jgi:hypothetical protein
MVRTALFWGILGLIAGPVIVYCLILLALYLDADCRTASTLTCRLDAGLNLVLGAIAGFVLFFAVSIVRTLVRRARS